MVSKCLRCKPALRSSVTVDRADGQFTGASVSRIPAIAIAQSEPVFQHRVHLLAVQSASSAVQLVELWIDQEQGWQARLIHDQTHR